MATPLTGNWTGALITGAGLWDQLDRYDEMKENMSDDYQTLSQDLIDRSDFTGFTVGGYGGGGTVGGDGSVNVNLDPAQQAQAENLTGYADQFFGSASGDQGMREQNMYNKIRAVQEPGEERAYHNLESRLAAQGRLGLASSAYGSSPEMFNYNMAVGEARNSAALSAIEQARMQQMQDANIGSQFQQNAYLPQANMLNLLNSGYQGASLNQAGNLAGAGYAAQLGSDNIRGGVNAEKIRADIMMGLFNTAGQAFQNSGVDPVGSVLNGIFGPDGLFS